jgi:DNA-directed RNA polymerase subunit L
MNLKVLEEKDNELMIEIVGEEHSFPALLAWALLKDPNVEFAVYDKEHPLLGHAKLYVKTKRSSPWHALEKSIKTIESEFSDMLKATEEMSKTDKKKKK